MMSRLMLNLHEWGDEGILSAPAGDLDTLEFDHNDMDFAESECLPFHVHIVSSSPSDTDTP